MASDILTAVKFSSNLVADNSTHVKVDISQIETFVNGISKQDLEKCGRQKIVGFPLQFDTLDAHINFVSLLSLLNYGNEYNSQLLKVSDKGISDTMIFGILGAYISGCLLDVEWFNNVEMMTVSEFFGFPIDMEVEVAPATYMSKPGPLKPLGDSLLKTFNTVGEKLKKLNMKNLADLVLKYLPQTPDDTTASALVFNLANELRSLLCDCAQWGSDDALIDLPLESITQEASTQDNKASMLKVVFMRKAQLIVLNLHRHLKDEDARFNYDVSSLSAPVDCVTPAVLSRLGILNYSQQLQEMIDFGKNIPIHSDAEIEIRACSTVSCERIATLIKEKHGYDVTAVDVDEYLRNLAKTSPFSDISFHLSQDNIFY